MTEMEEKKLRENLGKESKEQIINLFIKLKKNFDKSQERLYKIEEELNQKTSLEELIDSLPE